MIQIIRVRTLQTALHPLFFIARVIHWHLLSDTQPIKSTNKIIKYFFCVGHFVNSNFSFMFAVREHLKLLQDAKNISFKVKTKIWGRRTVASTEDLSRHRFECSRSDRPSLFNNQNLFIMREQKGQSTKSAEEIVKDFIINDDVKNIKQTLTELFYEWVQSEIDYDQKQRSTVLFHYRAMMDFMDSAETFETERRAV